MGLVAPLPWDLPIPGIKPVSPALAGGFFTTESPGKPIIPVLIAILQMRNLRTIEGK